MVSLKIMWNSIISTSNAKFGGADIKNMYLKTSLDWYEYMKMPLQLIPKDIIEHHGLRKKPLMVMSTQKSEKYVRPPISRHSCQQAPQTLSCMHGYFKRFTTHLVQPVCGRLWHQIHWQRTPKASFCCPLVGDVQNCQRLEGDLYLHPDCWFFF